MQGATVSICSGKHFERPRNTQLPELGQAKSVLWQTTFNTKYNFILRASKNVSQASVFH